MAALPAIADPTIDAVRAAVEQRAAAEEPRPYLGMSSIGRPCDRELWLSFRWAEPASFACDTLWRFEDGHRSEDVMAGRLRLVRGVHLRTVDPRTGQQFAFVDLGGHFRGHCDGMVTGLLQAPNVLHVWEGKATDEKKQAELIKLKGSVGEKNALHEWDYTYYAQAVMYMAYAEATRHYLTCASPGARSMVGVRTDANLDLARTLRERAERVITASEPPPKLSENPGWYQCKMCSLYSQCHGRAMPAVNCRTCAHSTPEMDGDGRWSCALHRHDITKAEQLKGCAGHRYIPKLIPFAEVVDADPAANWIEYRMTDGRAFRNGEPAARSYTSEELRVIDPAMLCDAGADLLRMAFDGRHAEAKP